MIETPFSPAGGTWSAAVEILDADGDPLTLRLMVLGWLSVGMTVEPVVADPGSARGIRLAYWLEREHPQALRCWLIRERGLGLTPGQAVPVFIKGGIGTGGQQL